MDEAIAEHGLHRNGQDDHEEEVEYDVVEELPSANMNTKWTTCGRKLLKDGKTFFVRGVNYAPTPVGKPGRLDMLNERSIFVRDLKNLREMKANAVKTYDFYSNVEHDAFLDAAYNDGIDPIYTVFSIWIDQSLMEPHTSIDSKEFKQMIQNYREMAELTGNHPGVMGYSIGGEMNSITVVNDKSFWDKFAALTNAARTGLAKHGAKKIITTTFVDDGGLSFAAGEKFGADVDMWGSNVYQKNYPGSVIPTYMKVSGNKPLLVSEYGYPYASNIREGTMDELHHVGDLLVDQAVAMEQNFALKDKVNEQIIVGGFVFEYSDEWWKAGNEGIHNLGTTSNHEFPLGYLSEEFFGLYRAVPSEKGIDELHPRPTVGFLQKLWSQGPLSGENQLVSKCTSNNKKILRSNFDTEIDSEITGESLEIFLLVIVFGAFIALTMVLYQTKRRRAAYRRLSPKWKAPRLKDIISLEKESSV